MQALSFVGTLTSLMGNRGNKRTVTQAAPVEKPEIAPTVETIPYKTDAEKQRLLARNSKEKPTTATTSSGISISKEVT
jgi:hypothetical protein